MSDESKLRYLLDQPNMNVIKAIWLAMISEFEFKTEYIKGKENMILDALIRGVSVNHIAAMSSYGIDS